MTDLIQIDVLTMGGRNNTEFILHTWWKPLDEQIFQKFVELIGEGGYNFFKFKLDIVFTQMAEYIDCVGQKQNVTKRVIEQSPAELINELFELYMQNQEYDWIWNGNKDVFFKKVKKEYVEISRYDLMDFDYE